MRKVLNGTLFIAIMFFILIPYQAHAEGKLHLEAEIGIDNRVKYETPTVLTITVTNNGEAFSGDFVIDNRVNYSIGSGIVLPLDLASGETKTIPIYLSGFNNDYNLNNMSQSVDIFSFYEGGIKKGKKIEHDGAKNVSPRMMSPLSKIAIVLTTRKDDIRAFEDLRKPLGDELYTYYATNKNDPILSSDANGFAGVDLIIFDDIALNDLSQEQQEAIYKWVQLGGTVAFAPSQNPTLNAGILKDVLPLSYTGETLTVPKEVLKNYLNYDATQDEIVIQQTNIKESSWPSLQLDGYTFGASTNIGRGNVIQFAFPLYDPVITKFNNYGLLLKNTLKLNTQNNGPSPYTTMGSALEWKYVNELFETFKIHVGVLVAGILIYMAIVGPILYVMLKRKDKREKMWLFIPVMAVVTSLFIFIIGAKDRILTPQIQSMALFEVGEDGTLNGIFNNAVLSNRSGAFYLEMDRNTSAMSGSADGSDPTNLHKKSYFKETSNGHELALLNFSYWSVQTVVGETLIPEGGQLISDLTLKNGQLTGTIENTLPVDLQDAKILSGSSEFEIGTLKAGEKTNINIDTKKNILAAPRTTGYYYGNNQNFDLRKEQLALLKDAAIYTTMNRNAPVLVGWSDISLTPISLKGGSKQSTVNYFVKSLTIETIIDSEISFTTEDFNVVLLPDDINTWGHIENHNNLSAYISEGEIPLHYSSIQNDLFEDVKWSYLEVKYDNRSYDLSIINKRTSEPELLENGQLLLKENIGDYLGDNQTIEFIINRFLNQDNPNVKLPSIVLKGEPLK